MYRNETRDIVFVGCYMATVWDEYIGTIGTVAHTEPHQKDNIQLCENGFIL